MTSWLWKTLPVERREDDDTAVFAARLEEALQQCSLWEVVAVLPFAGSRFAGAVIVGRIEVDS